MKKYSMEKVNRVVVSKVKCDDCDRDCSVTYYDIQSKASFSEKINLIKTVCWKCYDKQYKEVGAKNSETDNEEFLNCLKKAKP
jgi:hypothetical protein